MRGNLESIGKGSFRLWSSRKDLLKTEIKCKMAKRRNTKVPHMMANRRKKINNIQGLRVEGHWTRDLEKIRWVIVSSTINCIEKVIQEDPL